MISYAKYDYWANAKLLDANAKIEANLLDQEVPSSFTTLRRTWGHILDAHHIWLARMGACEMPEALSFPKDQDLLNFKEDLLSHSSALLSYIQENNLSETVSYSNSKGDVFAQSKEAIIWHVFNHATYHRGQIVNMIRQLRGDFKLPSTDMITFYRETGLSQIEK